MKPIENPISYFLFFIFSSLAYPTIAEEKTYGNVLVDKVSTIYDGDTFYVTIKKWPDIIGKNIAIRVKGVDTPEIKGACYKEILQAREAKKFTVQLLRNAKKVELKNISRDKYFRIDADVYLDGKNLAKEIIRQNFGIPYSGGIKFDWCSNNQVIPANLKH